jgi:hypothetical protein
MKRALVVLALVFAACGGNSPTDPTESIVRGRLSGIVTIGPNCPPPQECPTQGSAYALRKVLVYDAARLTLLHTVDIDSRGAYLIDLPIGTYNVDVKKLETDRVTGFPKTVTIQRSTVTSVNIEIDTGIR